MCKQVRSRMCGCLVTWFCYQIIAKPGNRTDAHTWPDSNFCHFIILWVHSCLEKDSKSGWLMELTSLIARFMGPTWGPSGADRPQVGPMLAPHQWVHFSTGDNFDLVKVQRLSNPHPDLPSAIHHLFLWCCKQNYAFTRNVQDITY